MGIVKLLVTWISLFVWGVGLRAAYVEPPTVAVQIRPKPLAEEIALHVSYLPNDHFNHYAVMGGSLTHYFNDYLGWEIANFNLAKRISTELEENLLEKYSVLPEKTDRIMKWITTNIVYSPLYMKNLFMKNSILWGDLSFIGGYGITQLKEKGMVNTFDVGAAIRFFPNSSITYRIDFRQMIFMTTNIESNLAITLGISYNFGHSWRGTSDQ